MNSFDVFVIKGFIVEKQNDKNLFCFSGVKNEIEEIGGGQFLSEFGLCKPDLDR